MSPSIRIHTDLFSAKMEGEYVLRPIIDDEIECSDSVVVSYSVFSSILKEQQKMGVNSEYVFAKVGFINSNSHAGIGIKVQKMFQNVS